ncbi:MAG: ribonuclease T2-like [Bogoriella megaspora]|nr:MAG: ribonuclease T2-like [Bogoriella megaspora]
MSWAVATNLLNAPAREAGWYLELVMNTTSYVMPQRFSLVSLGKVTLAGAQLLLGSGILYRSNQKSCPRNSVQLSCHNNTPVTDSCCFQTPGGEILQTQLWDTHPSTGPGDSWTVHGLWPDNCDGTYEANCDKNRVYNNITQIIQEGKAQNDLLDAMRIYWKDMNVSLVEAAVEPSLQVVMKDFGHMNGASMGHVSPKCFASYKPQEEVVSYFETTIKLFSRLPTYKLLETAGITPSTTKEYSRDKINDALKDGHQGNPVTIRCRHGGLQEVWYHFNVRGILEADNLVPSQPSFLASNCPKTVKYFPKYQSS